MLEYIITNWMDVLGTLLGFLYIWFEFKENWFQPETLMRFFAMGMSLILYRQMKETGS